MCVFRFLRGKKKVSHVLVRNVAPKPTQFPGNADPNEPLGLYAVQDDVEVHLRSSQGILESWPERLQFLIYDIYDCFSCRMCIWYDLLSLSVWFSLSLSLSLCVYLSTCFDSNGWFTISIHRSCLWECSILISVSRVMRFYCQDMLGHLFRLCIATLGLPAALQYINCL